jgi:hypothetical protein
VFARVRGRLGLEAVELVFAISSREAFGELMGWVICCGVELWLMLAYLGMFPPPHAFCFLGM